MGVYIREAKVALVTNKEIQDMFHYMMVIDWRLRTPIKTHEELVSCMEHHLVRIKKEHGISSTVNDLIEIMGKLEDAVDKTLVRCYANYLMGENPDEGLEVDNLQQMSIDFPHWYGRTMWDDTNKKLCTNNRPIGITQGYNGESVSMSYVGYGHLRETISESLLGSSARSVWRLNFYQAYRRDTFRRNIYLLVNGSDCEGIIVPEVVHQIASSLTSERAREMYHKNNSDYDIEYFDNLVQVFESASNNGNPVMFG